MLARAATLILLSLLAVAGAAPAAQPMVVAVSTPPQAYFLERLGGDSVRPLVMLPPGRSPATYEPTPKQLAALGDARLYFRAGVPFEKSFLPKLKRNFPKLRVVDTNQGIKLRPLEEAENHGHGHGALDPHVWLSPPLAKLQAATMARALSRADPAQADAYAAKLALLMADLDRVDKKIAQMLAPYRGRTVLVFHPAYGYFLHAYGLRQKAVETGGKRPGPRQLAHLMEQAQEQGARVIFVQPQFSSASARAIAGALGAVVVPLDPLALDYLANLEHMASAIAAALR
jgi:zinc transport system substrate-binding protein